jgi:uncharacterized protein
MPQISPDQLRTLTLLSPFAIIALGHLTARAWIPTIIVFWASIAILIYMNGTSGRGVGRGFGFSERLRTPTGSFGWTLLVLAIAALPLPIFLRNYHLLDNVTIAVLWLGFGLINPCFEEMYWRGVLMDASSNWSNGKRLLYTSTFFAASHPLMLGVNSIGVRSMEVLISTFILGMIWGWVAIHTRSLRWVIVSHCLVDLVGLSIPVFLNRYVPGESLACTAALYW